MFTGVIIIVEGNKKLVIIKCSRIWNQISSQSFINLKKREKERKREEKRRKERKREEICSLLLLSSPAFVRASCFLSSLICLRCPLSLSLSLSNVYLYVINKEREREWERDLREGKTIYMLTSTIWWWSKFCAHSNNIFHFNQKMKLTYEMKFHYFVSNLNSKTWYKKGYREREKRRERQELEVNLNYFMSSRGNNNCCSLDRKLTLFQIPQP